MTYETTRSNFLRKLWSIKMVRVVMTKGIINKDQFQQIMYDGVKSNVITPELYIEETGETYEP